MGGAPINEAVWEKMMSECDVNGDGKVNDRISVEKVVLIF